MMEQDEMSHDNITLVGMPGAGKSTLGVVLAKKLGYRFVDTDLLLQESEGMLLSQLIEQRGIEGFIEAENALLAGLSCEHHVIATGGSAVYGDEGMRNLASQGHVLYIRTTLEELRTRLHMDLLDRGVVMRHATTLQELYDERTPLYERYATLVVDTVGMTTHEAVEALAAALRDAGVEPLPSDEDG